MIHKKTMLSVGTVTSIAAPIAAVVSCGNNFGDKYEYYGSIQTITDAGSVADKSFNQSAFEAGQDYASVVKSNDKNVTFGFSQPKVTTTTMLQKAYESALKAGSRTLILPGFTHTAAGDAIHFAQRMHSKYPDARYICADGFADDKVFGKPDPAKPGEFLFGSGEEAANNAGFYNLGFAANQSGFLAAIYGGIYFNEVKKVSQPIKAWTFGGVAIPFGVTSYMDGYLQGQKWFNTYIADKHSVRASDSQPYQRIKPVFMDGNGPSISDFTGGFDPGMATSKVQKMINDGVQMILPVAGPQTGDVTGVIAANKKIGDVFAFGVDTDQSLVYNPQTIMGSAVKGIYAATSFAIDALRKNPNHKAFPSFTYTMTGDAKTYFDDLKSRLTNKYIGEGMSRKDAEFKAGVRTMPTGFVPSSPNVSLNLRANKIYTDAIEALKEDPSNGKFDESGFGKWGPIKDKGGNLINNDFKAGYSYLGVAFNGG